MKSSLIGPGPIEDQQPTKSQPSWLPLPFPRGPCASLLRAQLQPAWSSSASDCNHMVHSPASLSPATQQATQADCSSIPTPALGSFLLFFFYPRAWQGVTSFPMQRLPKHLSPSAPHAWPTFLSSSQPRDPRTQTQPFYHACDHGLAPPALSRFTSGHLSSCCTNLP